jgi:hypothetical protein
LPMVMAISILQQNLRPVKTVPLESIHLLSPYRSRTQSSDSLSYGAIWMLFFWLDSCKTAARTMR